ncbi:MAG: hypothetical protein IPI95_13240 [Flavobacteriales bacterium]|nr:hypothetical protein [Flavobacteriales bacterium]
MQGADVVVFHSEQHVTETVDEAHIAALPARGRRELYEALRGIILEWHRSSPFRINDAALVILGDHRHAIDEVHGPIVNERDDLFSAPNI